MMFLRFLPLALLLSVALPALGSSETSTPHPRIDRYGDPLPPSVIARLGTLCFRGVRGCLAFSPDGKLLAAATGEIGERVTLWQATTGREVRRIDASAALSKLAFSPDGKRLACSTNDNRCQVFEMASGKKLFAVKGACGDFSGDGKMLVTADAYATDPRGYVWDAATGRQLHQWPGAKGNNGLLLAVGGQTVAVLDWSRRTEAEIRDIATGKKIRSLRRAARAKPNPGIPDGWRYLTLTRDDKTLAAVSTTGVGTDDIAIELWDIESGKMTTTWRGSVPNCCVFSSDGKRLAWTTGYGAGGGPRLWVGERTGDGGMRVTGTPTYSVEPPYFSPDGKLLAVVTHGSIVSFREAATGKEVRALETHDSPVTFLAFTPDGRHVISQAGADLFAWETASGRLLRRGPGPLVGRESIEHVLPDGRLLTNDPDQNLVRLRDMLAGQVEQRMAAKRPNFFVPSVSVPASAGRRVAIHRGDSEVSVFDLKTGQRDYRLDDTEARQALKLSDDGDVLVWCNGADGKRLSRDRDGKVNIHVHRRASGKTFVLAGPPKPDRWLHHFEHYPCLSPDGHWLLFPTQEGRLRRWDLTTGEELSPLPEPLGTVDRFRWSPDGRFAAMCGTVSPRRFKGWGGPLEWRVWDVARGTRLAHLTLPRPPDRVYFSPDGRTMLITNEQGGIHSWEVATGKERKQLRGHLSYRIGALAVSADGRMLVSGGHDSQVLVWDLTGHMPDGQWRPARLSADKLRDAWKTLGGADAASAYAAMWQLAVDPEGTIALLRERLRPV
ncbi:MAG TPA: WD40 repeat domain-containing protein, partial [Gemmataceae bacterium]